MIVRKLLSHCFQSTLNSKWEKMWSRHISASQLFNCEYSRYCLNGEHITKSTETSDGA